MDNSSRWDPFETLAEHPLVVLTRHPSATLMGGGMSVAHGDRAVVVLDPKLSRRDERAVLGHELVHLEHAGVVTVAEPPAWAPGSLTEREERTVDETVARRLVPHAELAWWVTRACDAGEAVTAAQVAEEFDVPEPVARRALDQLRRLWRS